MSSAVRVTLDERSEWLFRVDEQERWSREQAGQWLDTEFIALGGEPLRPTGKLLMADKVLVVAREAGRDRLNDPTWSQAFARAVSAALAKPVVSVDLQAMSVSF